MWNSLHFLFVGTRLFAYIRLIFAILNGKVSAAINHNLARNFRAGGLNITPEQYIILMHLSEHDGVTQQQLCTATYKDKPSMTRLLSGMERLHLVMRIKGRDDRRSNTVHLTHTGRDLKDQAQRIALLTLKESLKGLKYEDICTSQEVLRQIFSNIIHAKG